MKTILSIIFTLALSVGIARAQGPGERAKDAAETAANTAENVGHSVARGTKKAVNTVVDALTPEPDARRVDVTVNEYRIDMPTTLKRGKTAFVVKNAGKKKHSFEVQGNEVDRKFITDLDPNQTKVLHVVLKRGTYTVFCPLDEHRKKGMEVSVTVP
jgi:iron uptake system EfeUOB component EfeO/EfeM